MVEWKKLGEIGEICMCKRIMKDQTSDNGDIPFYKIGTFGKKADAYISRNLFENYKTNFSYPKKGEILISAAGTIGRSVVFDGEDAYYQDSNIVWIANDEKTVTNRFLFYFYQIAEWKTDGGTIKRLYNYNLKNTKIPVPSLEEQNRIVGILDTFMDSIENLKQQISQRRKQYEHYRDQLLDLEGKEGVEWKKLNTVCEVINGRAYKQQELLATGKYRVLRVGNFFSNDSWYFSDLELDDKYYCNEGDLLYAWSASFGPHIWTEEKTIYHYHIWKMNCSEELDKKYMFYWLQSENMRKQAFSHLHGATMAHLTKALMESLNVPLLPLSEQQRIVSILDTFEASISNLEAQLAQRQKQYEYYRNQLLTFE